MTPLGDFLKKPKEESSSQEESSKPPSGQLGKILSPKTILFLETIDKKSTLLKLLVKKICENNSSIPLERSFQSIMEREKVSTTFMKNGFAVPHARLPHLKKIHAALGILPKGFMHNGIQTQFVFLFLSPEEPLTAHLQILSKASWLFQNSTLKENLLSAQNPDTAISLIIQAENEAH